MTENFELASRMRHIIIQPSDQALNPPESYLFVQDGLIISCGVIYSLCYLFCMIRTYSDRTLPGADWGSVQFLYVTFLSLTFTIDLGYSVLTDCNCLVPGQWLMSCSTPSRRRVRRRNGCVSWPGSNWISVLRS